MTQKKPLVLSIETATSVCSAAMLRGDKLLSTNLVQADRRHNETLADMVLNLIEESHVDSFDTDIVAVSIGPGSFTGLRVGLSYSKGFAMAVNAAIIPVCTLDALAYVLKEKVIDVSADGENDRKTAVRLCPMTVARRGEAFGAFFDIEGENCVRSGEIFTVNAERLTELLNEERCFLGGEGAEMLADESDDNMTDSSRLIRGVKASASMVGRLAARQWNDDPESIPPAGELEPLYMKEFTVKNKRRF